MSDNGLPKAGDICECCRERWETKDSLPKKLVALPTTTERYHDPVAICLYCDGEPLLLFATRKVRCEKEEADAADAA